MEERERVGARDEIIVDKVRRASMCGDQDRKMFSNLIDQMAILAGQVATVARMTDENDENEENMRERDQEDLNIDDR